MDMVTYDGLNGASAQNCKTNSFTFISMLKAPINSRKVSVNLLRLVLGRNVNGNDPATHSPTGDVAPNDGLTGSNFLLFAY